MCPRAPTAEVIAHGCRFSVIDQEHVLAGLATDGETAKVQREARGGVGRDREGEGVGSGDIREQGTWSSLSPASPQRSC